MYQNLKKIIEQESFVKKEYRIISLDSIKNISQTTGTPQREVEIVALDLDIVPERYLKNMGTVKTEGQKQLLQSKVAIVGCGGLGGTNIELCARMGIGHLVLIDGDRFAQDNLNRQLLSTEENLGELKVDVAKSRVKAINSSVEVDVHPVMLSDENSLELLSGCNVVIDALDNITSRFVLQKAARELKIPFVHGAIAGFQGQVMTVFPEDSGLDLIYGGIKGDRGIEQKTGNPSPTPTMIASWQVQEVIKIILKKEGLLRNKLLFLDAQTPMIDIIDVV